MGIRTYNPYTPSRRNMTGSDFSEITKTTPEKSLLAKKSKTAGRNNQGKITVRHHGGGNRQKYRLIDFKRNITINPHVLFIPYLQTSSSEPPCAPTPGTRRKWFGTILRISSKARP